jgi:hypothetical protein
MDWKCSKNKSYTKTICRTSSSAESFAMLHFSHCKKENLVVSMMRVRQYAYFVEKISLFSMKISLYSMEKLSHPACSKGYHLLYVENSDRHCIILTSYQITVGGLLQSFLLYRKEKREGVLIVLLLKDCV